METFFFLQKCVLRLIKVESFKKTACMLFYDLLGQITKRIRDFHNYLREGESNLCRLKYVIESLLCNAVWK